ncbi:MAG: UDP-N-acetylglucosamine--N-acetylmuramyl-(pentapeptide) pyrophosphoryl-undecaprenol N-acetylglucosamine transferase [Pseudomonadota bacterium]
MSVPHLVIAAGGTGGHMFPAQALAEEMLARGWRVVLSTDARGAGYAGGFPAAVIRTVAASASPSRGGVWARLLVPLRLAWGVAMAAAAMLQRRPACVIGFGGYPAIPALTAAWILRIPRLIHEQNAVLGRVNEVFARRVHFVACGSWPTDLPRGVTGRHIGNPLRQAVAQAAGTAYAPPGLAAGLLVFGGSQGAGIMRVVPEAVALLSDRMRAGLTVAQQARAEDAEAVRAAYAAMGVAAEVQPFFTDMPKRLATAQLVICRAGAASVADIAAVGRPAIFVPLALALRNEQTANAAAMAMAGAAEIVPESQLTAARLAGHIAAILGDPARASAMAHAAAQLGRVDAAQRLADIVIALAKGERP